ncbi:MAG: NAD(P)H-hydrate dehydratase [Pseudomonadota bacterium]
MGDLSDGARRSAEDPGARALLSARDVAAIDARSAALGRSGAALMAEAGRAVARAAEARWSGRDGAAAILAGPGNNGGDGFVAATALMAAGRSVRLYALGAGPEGGDAAEARAAFEAAGGVVRPIEEAHFDGAAYGVDALFGVGLARAISGAAADAIERMNASAAPALAVDMPSGVEADQGRALGPAVRADVTVTFIRPKRGHFLSDGALLSGDLEVVDIGQPAAAMAAIETPVAREIEVEADGSMFGLAFVKAALDAHKYDYGHVAAVVGGRGCSGAGRLAARAALRSGAGLATVLAPPEAMSECAAQLTAVMLREIADDGALAQRLADKRVNAVVFGPGAGLGEAVLRRVAAILAAGPRTAVLDADALSAHEADPEALFRAVRTSEAMVVLTPHGGEFARLFPDLAARLRSDAADPMGKIEATRAAAARSGAVVLFKGLDTVVAAPDGRAGAHAAVRARAAPWLATAGAGDVLAGMIAGLAARGWPAFEAACGGAWLHASAARAAGAGLIAEDLPEAASAVFRDLESRRSTRRFPGSSPLV